MLMVRADEAIFSHKCHPYSGELNSASEATGRRSKFLDLMPSQTLKKELKSHVDV